MKFIKCLWISSIISSVTTALTAGRDYIAEMFEYIQQLFQTYTMLRYGFMRIMITSVLSGLLYWMSNYEPGETYDF